MPDVAQRKTYTSTMEMMRMAPMKCLRNSKKGTATEGPKSRGFSPLISGQKAHRARKTVCARGDTVAGNIQSRGKASGNNVKNPASAGALKDCAKQGKRPRSLKTLFRGRRKFDILRGMNPSKSLFDARKRRFATVLIVSFLALFAWNFYAHGQNKSDFPDGYDAVQAAPNSHKVIFENAFVRVLQVTIPPPGATEPMHHHRWPSFFLSWDTGGKTPHVRYHRPDGSVRDEPSREAPVHSGRWSVQWMKPEPMHAIEVVENPGGVPNSFAGPSLLRIELKCHP